MLFTNGKSDGESDKMKYGLLYLRYGSAVWWWEVRSVLWGSGDEVRCCEKRLVEK